MPYNGAGIFTLTTGNPVVTGTVISSSWANNTLSDLANNGLTNCITKDGQTIPTANLPMGNFNFTNLAAPTGNGQALRWEQLQKGSDIASAATIAIPNEGQEFTVTGTTGITAFSGGFPGRYVFLQFSGVLTITNSASLVLPNGQNVTTAANEVYSFICISAGVWVCVVYPQKFYPGRLLGIQIFTSNSTYNPGVYNGVTATTVIKKICGGGGGSGGVQATSATQIAVSNGGNGGAYVEWIGPAASESATIGAPGAAGAAGFNAGGAGGTSSGGSISAVGGLGGGAGAAAAPPQINGSQANNGGGALGPASGGVITVNRSCSLGGYGIALSLTLVLGGTGGDSPFGSSSRSGSTPPSTSYGCGGPGIGVSVNSVATAGIAGRQGVIIYEEYA